MSAVIKFDAPPVLGEFLRSDAFCRCVVGPLGSGKSSACNVELFRRAQTQRKAPDGYRYSRWAVVRNCYDAATEILTEHRGWVKFPDLLETDRVAALHGDTVGWEIPTQRYAAPYQGEMVSLNSQTIDLLVTPEHHLWVSPRRTRKNVWHPFEHQRADEIEGVGELWRMRATADFPGDSCDKSKDFFEFLGFWFAEGYAGTYPRKDTSGNHWRLVVTQNPGNYVEDLLTRAGFEFGKSLKDNGICYNYTISHREQRVKDLILELVQYGHATHKHLPRYIIEAPKEHALAFLKGFHMGDGSGGTKNPTRPEILHTSSPQLATDLHEMATRAGYCATMGHFAPMWAVTLHDDSRSSPVIQKRYWGRQQYDGMVYCVEVSTHVVLVRRNGKSVWCGQTYRELKDTTRKTFERWVPPSLGRWMENDFTFVLEYNDVRAEVLFRALDTPQDAKKLLSLELTGAYFNELKELPKEAFDAMQGRVGRYPDVSMGGPSWYGIWADTNPWHTGHWGHKLFSQASRAAAVGRAGRRRAFEIFEQPGGMDPRAENRQNLPPDYYEMLMEGKDQEWIDVYVHGKYGVSDRGSVYGELLESLQRRLGITDFRHPKDGVYVNFDLGISDSTAMWFWRVGERENGWGIDFIDCYEAHGKPLSHFFGVLDKRGYQYSKFWLPHDARARTLQTNQTVYELFANECLSKRWGDTCSVQIVPSVSLADGLSATRWLLEQDTRFHTRCDQKIPFFDHSGLGALREYKYEWDPITKTYSRTPAHNWASHLADAARYTAVVCKVSEFFSRKPKPAVAPPSRLVVQEGSLFRLPVCMEDLWGMQKSRQDRIG